MNIILFDRNEIGEPFSANDSRVIHILDVLRRKVGDSTDVGLKNGPRGKAVLKSMNDREVQFDFVWGEEPEPLIHLDLIVGLSRPQTSRKVLQELTSLGVRSIRFVITDRGEASYVTSKLWTTDEWKRLVKTGVQQAFTTRFPEVHCGLQLESAIEAVSNADTKICMDNYEAPVGLLEAAAEGNSVVLAIGSERGWTKHERTVFRDNGYVLAHLGERPLRTETASIVSAGIVKALLESRG